MSSEAKWTIVSAILMVVTAPFKGTRVLTIPFFFVLILVLMLWAARVRAERDDQETE